ncbi:MAG: aminotransferase class I/II-fold pyridoxal phosphate-dependent enzyme [Chloroflexi bacterium]|nr:aminotransferase class I/II-fold pyridoxal phosphate-dependent enzyme [Chloroflexota bacterium]
MDRSDQHGSLKRWASNSLENSKGETSLASQTKAEILARHDANAALKTPLPGQITRHAKDLGADGVFSPLDERIIAAASEALEAGQTHYVDVPGIEPLREAIADYLNTSFSAPCQSGNIIVTAGLQESRFLTIQKIGENFDSIGIPAVAHPGLQKALGVRARNVVSLAVDPHRGYLPALDAIADAVAGGCRLLYLESPSRLSGAAYTSDEVAAIGQLLGESGASAIWDQGLAPWVEGGCRSLASTEESPAQVTAIGEAFPGMGLASWFIGYIAAPDDQIPAMQSQKQIMAICTSTAAQYAALEASSLFPAAHPPRLAQLKRLKSYIAESARDLNLDAIAGDALNIIALQASGGAAAKLRAAGFDCADGADFGAPAVIRLNVNTTTAEALQALR